MLKLTLTKQKPAQKKNAQVLRQNPEILNGGVIDNYAPAEQSNGSAGGRVQFVSQLKMKAVCSGNLSHPLAGATFKMRGRTDSEDTPQAQVPAEQELLSGFSLQSLGR